MSTLADASVRAALRDRLVCLTPSASRQWGRMTPHQMVCHLTDAFRMADGSRTPKQIDNIFTRNVVRFIALHTSLPWPKGVKTLPEADQEKAGTPPVEWQKDFEELVRIFDAFAGRESHPHPLFGPLRESEWNVWAFRHVNHHLTQFGL
jgi:hypothetical protein